MALEPGSSLGTYEVLAAIGKGGMDEVYRARDAKLKREVAIKSLLPEPTEITRNQTRDVAEGRRIVDFTIGKSPSRITRN